MFRVIVIGIISILFTLVGFASGIFMKCEAIVGPVPGPNIGDVVDIPMLSNPGAIALIDEDRKALITNGNELLILDLVTHGVDSIIEGLKSPQAIAIEENGSTCLIVQAGEPRFPGDPAGQILRVNFITKEKYLIASGFIDPKGIAIESNGETTLVIDQSNGGTLFRVNLQDGILTTIASGFPYSPLHAVALEPGNNTAIVGAGTKTWGGVPAGLLRVDLMTGDIAILMGGPGIPQRVLIEPGGATALVAGPLIGGEAGIARVDLETGANTLIFGSGLAVFCSYSIGDMVLSPDGSEVIFIWSIPGSGIQISRIYLSNNARETIIYAVTPSSIVLEENGNSLLMLSQSCISGLVSRLQIASGIVEMLPGGATNAKDLAVLPGNSEILITGGEVFRSYGHLLREDLLTGQASIIATVDPAPFGVVLEPSGETALISSGNKIMRIELAPGSIETITENLDFTPAGLALDTSGQILFAGSSDGNHVAHINLLTGEVIKIATFTHTPYYVALEPGDESLLVSLTNMGLSRIDLSTGAVTDIITEVSVSGKVVVESGGETALLATSEGIKRVRIRSAVPPPQPVLSVTPDTLDFGSVKVGSSKDLDFTVQNTGDGTLSGTASISTPFSIVAGNSFNIAAGESQTVTVRFSPTSSGTSMSNVTFTSNGGNALPVIQGEGVALCNPPTFVYVDNSGAYGLFEGIVNDVKTDDTTTANINIQATDLIDLPFLKPEGVQFWGSIDEIIFDSNAVSTEPNEEDTIGAFFAEHKLIAPGTHASFNTSFCKPGTVTFELGFSETAIGLTLADALLSIIPKVGDIPYDKVLSFADAIDDIPLVAAAHNHISNAIQAAMDKKTGVAFNELRLAGNDLRKLSFDKEQRKQLLQAYIDIGVEVTAKKLLRALLHAPIRVFKIFADAVVLAVQTDLGTAGAIRISLVAN